MEVLARVKSKELQVVDAATLLRVSYRQAKRLWRRYREEGAAGLKHRSAGRRSHRAYEREIPAEGVAAGAGELQRGGGRAFGPTLAAEHLESEDGLKVHAETLRRWMLAEGLWSRERKRRRHRNGGSARSILGSWCRWTEAFTRGWKSADRRAA